MKWFPHDTSTRDDDKIFELIDRHGLQGYGFFWVILEECYDAEETGFQVEVSDTWCKRTAKEFGLTDSRTIVRLLDTLAEVGLIDVQMWNEKIIFVPGIQKRSDEYMKKKQDAAERKRRQRQREKEASQTSPSVTSWSRVTKSDKADVTPSYTEIRDQNTDPKGGSYAHAHAIDPNPEPPPPEPEIFEAEFVDLEPEPQPKTAAQNSSPGQTVSTKPQRLGQDSIAPVFSDDENSSELSSLMRIRPDPRSYEFMQLNSAVKAEMRVNPLRFYPWKQDERTLEMFIQWQVNTMTGKKSAAEKRSIVEYHIREANASVPVETKKFYMLVSGQWRRFKNNAQTSESFADVSGENQAEKRVLEILTRARAEGRI